MRVYSLPKGKPRPAVDEWGIYDPDQAGLTAVLDRLEARRRSASAESDGQNMAASMREADALIKQSGVKAPK